MTGIEAIAKLFAGPGARDYLGEAVTIGEHMRQAGALAEAAGAPAPLVAAALLHDVGHLRGETDARHGPAGAQWLGQWFGPQFQIGYTISDGHGGTQVLVDIDGRGTANPWPITITTLDKVVPTSLHASDWLI